MNKDLKLAVLIDADNIPSKYVKEMMLEITKYGVPTIKRIYGDWTKPHVTKWKNILLENAISPVQQYGYTTGKNATDSAMIIDAMDILYNNEMDGFCIVSSDSDFTRLATRIRESGLKVIGIGEKKTPSPFIVACDKFIYLEILNDSDDNDSDDPEVGNTQAPKVPKKKKEKKAVEKLTAKTIKLIQTTVYDCADEDGWAFLGDVGSNINKKQPNFDPRNFGFYKLTPLIESIGKFDIEHRETANSRIKHIFIKNKKK